MAFTRRHYQEVARIIQRERALYADIPVAHSAISHIQDALKRMFAADNPRFDPTRFAMACDPRDTER